MLSSKPRHSGSSREHQAAKKEQSDESDPKPFRPGKAHIVREEPLSSIPTSTSTPKDTWYLDSCTSRHLSNYWEAFEDLREKVIDFTTTAGQVIRSEYVGTVVIPLKDGQSIKLEGVTYTPESNSNLISLCQLRESGIGYHDDPTSMTLRRGSEVIAYAKRNQNLFILDTVTVGKFMLATEAVTTTNRTPTAPPATTSTTTPTKTRAMAISGRDRPTHLAQEGARPASKTRTRQQS